MSRIPGSTGVVVSASGTIPTGGLWTSGFSVSPSFTLVPPSEWSRLLTALSLPPPGEDDGRYAWWAALTKAVSEGDAFTVGIFADWCADRSFTTWERIAREEVRFMEGRLKQPPPRYAPGVSG